MFYKSSRRTLINAVMKYLNFHSSASKLESITCKFTESCTPSEVVFEEFHYKCRTVILKNASRWLTLRATLFSKYSSQWLLLKDSCKDTFILEILSYTYSTFLTDVMLKRNKFLCIFLGQRFPRKV